MTNKLLIAVLGNRDSGKSTTWQTLFNDRNIRTAQKSLRKLLFPNQEYTNVFLINGSPQERQKDVEEIIQVENEPEIVLCSLQYSKEALRSLNYFVDNNYFIYLHWLNPGFNDNSNYHDNHQLVPSILEQDSLIGVRNGKTDPTDRVDEIKNYIYDWASRHKLLKTLTKV